MRVKARYSNGELMAVLGFSRWQLYRWKKSRGLSGKHLWLSQLRDLPEWEAVILAEQLCSERY